MPQYSCTKNTKIAVKVYAREGEGIEKESEVYRKIGNHPSYSKLIYKGENFIVLKRLKEITLYDAVHKGIKILSR